MTSGEMAKEKRSKYAKAEHKNSQQQRKERAARQSILKVCILEFHQALDDSCLFIKTQFLMPL